MEVDNTERACVEGIYQGMVGEIQCLIVPSAQQQEIFGISNQTVGFESSGDYEVEQM